MKCLIKNKYLTIGVLIFIIVLISIKLILFSPTKANHFISKKLYKESVSEYFNDANFYNCVVDAYNKQNATNLPYTAVLNQDQLNSIESLICNSRMISDSTGIEKLTNLTNLNLNDNQLKAIDVSNNTKLSALKLSNNKLTSINLYRNRELSDVSLNKNQLTTVDLGTNIELSKLDLSYNQLGEIDLSNNNKLAELYLTNNKLTTINLNNNKELVNLYLGDNQLTTVDVSNNTKLIDLNLDNNKLTALDLRTNTKLTDLNSNNNKLTIMDLNNNTELVNLDLGKNQLETINLSNNKELINLYLYDNQLTTINVDGSPKLATLGLSKNQLMGINLNNNKVLINLSLDYNQLTAIDLSDNSELIDLVLDNNQLMSIDVSNNEKLTKLFLDNNQLTTINLINNKELESLHLIGNKLSTLDLSNNPKLFDNGSIKAKYSQNVSNLVTFIGDDINKMKIGLICPEGISCDDDNINIDTSVFGDYTINRNDNNFIINLHIIDMVNEYRNWVDYDNNVIDLNGFNNIEEIRSKLIMVDKSGNYYQDVRVFDGINYVESGTMHDNYKLRYFYNGIMFKEFSVTNTGVSVYTKTDLPSNITIDSQAYNYNFIQNGILASEYNYIPYLTTSYNDDNYIAYYFKLNDRSKLNTFENIRCTKNNDLTKEQRRDLGYILSNGLTSNNINKNTLSNVFLNQLAMSKYLNTNDFFNNLTNIDNNFKLGYVKKNSTSNLIDNGLTGKEYSDMASTIVNSIDEIMKFSISASKFQLSGSQYVSNVTINNGNYYDDGIDLSINSSESIPVSVVLNQNNIVNLTNEYKHFDSSSLVLLIPNDKASGEIKINVRIKKQNAYQTEAYTCENDAGILLVNTSEVENIVSLTYKVNFGNNDSESGNNSNTGSDDSNSGNNSGTGNDDSDSNTVIIGKPEINISTSGITPSEKLKSSNTTVQVDDTVSVVSVIVYIVGFLLILIGGVILYKNVNKKKFN